MLKLWTFCLVNIFFQKSFNFVASCGPIVPPVSLPSKECNITDNMDNIVTEFETPVADLGNNGALIMLPVKGALFICLNNSFKFRIPQ